MVIGFYAGVAENTDGGGGGTNIRFNPKKREKPESKLTLFPTFHFFIYCHIYSTFGATWKRPLSKSQFKLNFIGMVQAQPAREERNHQRLLDSVLPKNTVVW